MNDAMLTRRDFFAAAILGAAGTGALATRAVRAESTSFTKERGVSRGAGNPAFCGGSAPVVHGPQEAMAVALPAGKLCGLLADAARVPGTLSYYNRLIDFCNEWGLNTLVFTLADDQGSALRFKSHPELLTHKHALTYGEARRLSDYAAQRGVDIIPLIESFGHTRYITAVPRYSGLADTLPGSSTGFTGLVPVAPESTRLLSDLYKEIASIFSSPYLHGGCDEVGWGGAELSRRALRTKTRAQIWDEYLNSLNRICQGLGRQFIVWGDYVLRKQPQILTGLDRNIIIMDWDYWDSDPTSIAVAAQEALRAGFRVIGAPALMWCRWGPRAGVSQLRNIDAYAETYRKIIHPRCLGVVIANWVPSRYLQRSIWDGMAYGAIAVQQGSSKARDSALKEFVQRFYGAQWNGSWSEVFESLYSIAPCRKSCSPTWMHPVLPVPWGDEKELLATLEAKLTEAPPFTRLLSQLVFCVPSIRRNASDFAAFRLSIEYLEQIFWRNTALVTEGASPSGTRESAVRLIKTIAARDQHLLRALERDWDEGRPRDSVAKAERVFDFEPEDQLVLSFRRAAGFSEELADDPDRFVRLLSRHKTRIGQAGKAEDGSHHVPCMGDKAIPKREQHPGQHPGFPK